MVCASTDFASSASRGTQALFLQSISVQFIVRRLSRYPDINFNPEIRDFTCPKCANSCNCTKCTSKRGETYVSSGRRAGSYKYLDRGASRGTPQMRGAPPTRA